MGRPKGSKNKPKPTFEVSPPAQTEFRVLGPARSGTQDKVKAALDKATAKRKKYSVPLSHPTYIIESCPNCEYPEADGGYCPDCGWSKPVKLGRVY